MTSATSLYMQYYVLCMSSSTTYVQYSTVQYYQKYREYVPALNYSHYGLASDFIFSRTNAVNEKLVVLFSYKRCPFPESVSK